MKEIFDRHEFGKKLKDARKSIGLTQSQLAEKTGFSQNTISNWENGVREPESIGDLVSIASALGMDVNYFVKNVEHKNDRDNYYGDHIANLQHLSEKPDLLHLYNEIYNNHTLQLLFDKTQDLTPDDLEMVLTIISGIRKERGLD
ncbi:helix-turn-helix transcriptional regulator [Erysipelothrix sp. HDW6B]|uniref:helix-turn-helix domain-containing protein n=1 Tax=Erysipelothrix sp. HDW6B TaxID=2714929 RepID=UPI00140DB592|nr:helix-turn-helix transcriptional regulator [Erysipelothrix sp. HDW6B]QIK85827.1 helix-turn-helix transcriptional regulator [Erysipelothrix sp. HDW6B]